MPADPCPAADTHTPAPTGYLEWHAWAEEISRTHDQVRCSGCGRFAVWVPRKRADALPDDPEAADTP